MRENTNRANTFREEQKLETQKKNLRLQFVLLFYDYKDWGKLQKDNEGFICQESSKMKEYPFEIKGGTQSEEEIVEQYLFPIQEKLELKKGKTSTEIKIFQNKIIRKIESLKIRYSSDSSEIDKIYLDILYPTDNFDTGLKDIYLSFLFDRRFALKLGKYIDIKKSTISILYPHEENCKENDNDVSASNFKPSKLDAQIAALMSHYVYFYLDWLEYYRVHANGIGKRISEKISREEDNVNEVIDIINEYNIINGFFCASFAGIITFGGTKIKGRIINRLREIARASNYLCLRNNEENSTNNNRITSIDDLYKKFENGIVQGNIDELSNAIEPFLSNDGDSNTKKTQDEIRDTIQKKIIKELQNLIAEYKKTKSDKLVNKENFKKFVNDILAINVYINILLESKKNKRPVGFYELYNKFGYWDYIKDETLKNEAKQWYVSHPYMIYKNDYATLEKSAKEDNSPIERRPRPYNKLLGILPRKTNEIFIAIEDTFSQSNTNENNPEKRWLVYNTVLTHGMDQLSGYGGLLFTKVGSDGNAEKFAYCTKGTDVNSFNDWILVDLMQGLTGFSLQHLHNVKNAITINKKVKECGNNLPLFYCGHSLGGGLASACAIASKGRHAITFNAAGLNFLGVIATRTLGGCNYGWDVPKMVHPIRIDGEAVDVFMLLSFLILAHLNERAYGGAPLILKLKGRGVGSFLYDSSEIGAKHGINNFLYKPLMDALDIVGEKTIKYPVEDVNLKNTSISTLGVDNFKMVEKTSSSIQEQNASLGVDNFKMVEKTDGKVFIEGNYSLTFKTDNECIIFKSCLKCSYEDVKKLFSGMNESAVKYLKETYDFESPLE